MSESLKKVLLRTIRSAYKAIYRKGERDQDKITDYIYKEIGFLRKANEKRVWDFFIKKAIVQRGSRGGVSTGPDLFENMEQVLPLLHEDGTHTFCELGDFGLAEIEQHDKQIDANMDAVKQAKDDWARAKVLVVPLLKAHTDWLWRDAVKSLRESGDV